MSTVAFRVDLDAAFEDWAYVCRVWQAKRRKGELVSKPINPPPPTRDQWVRDRIQVIRQHPSGIAYLRAWWPPDILPPKQNPIEYTNLEIDLIVPVLDKIEAELGLGWNEPDPGQTYDIRKIGSTERTPEQIETEADVGFEGVRWESAVAVVRRRLDALSVESQNWISDLTTQAREAGFGFGGLQGYPTQRRIYLARACILAVERRVAQARFEQVVWSCSSDWPDHPDVLKQQVGSDPDVWDFMPQAQNLGERLGRMDWRQAKTLASLVSTLPTSDADDAGTIGPIPYAAPRPTVAEQKAEEIERAGLEELSKPDLKQQCRDAGLPVGGTKAELVDRLLQSMAQEAEGETT